MSQFSDYFGLSKQNKLSPDQQTNIGKYLFLGVVIFCIIIFLFAVIGGIFFQKEISNFIFV